MHIIPEVSVFDETLLRNLSNRSVERARLNTGYINLLLLKMSNGLRFRRSAIGVRYVKSLSNYQDVNH